MRHVVVLVCFMLLLGSGHRAHAQDPQFSQFYAAPLYLNPAFSGSTQMGRAGINYRNQWPSLDASFTTYSAYFDYFFTDYNSGVGLLLMHDQIGLAGLQNTSVGLQYAYQLPLSETFTFRPGFQAAFHTRDINFNELVFSDQIDNNGNISFPSAEDLSGGQRANFFDISVGGLLYTPNFWMGFSAHHLNEPNQTLIGETDRLPLKWSAHAGYRILLGKSVRGGGYFQVVRDRSITPTIQFKKQGQFDQLDVGLYLTIEPIVLGAWYRGLPVDNDFGFSDNESLVMLFGLTFNGFNLGYSYDYTLSELGVGTGGAHEISINYMFNLDDPRKPPKNVRQIPCPRF